MLKFSDYLFEEINDSLQSSKPEETERHRKQYYDDKDLESIFHRLGGRYILDRDRSDISPAFRKGEEVKLSSVAALPDSRGVIRYHGVTPEGISIPMSHFKKPPIGRAGRNQQSLEQEQIEHINKAIQEQLARTGKKTVKVRTADGRVHEVAGIKAPQNTGWPKADAYLHDERGNPVHWMSLKGDTFQQWGGYRGLDEHPVMQEALSKFQQLKKKVAPGQKYLPPRSAYHFTLDPRNPQHVDLLQKSMYGIDHGREYGPNNVNAIYSGNTVHLRQSQKPGEEDIFELHPNALYVNRNDNTSDLSPAKILVTNRAGLNQKETGGRVMVTHADNVGNSREVGPVLGGSVANAPQKKKAAPKRKSKDEEPSGEMFGAKFKGPLDD